MPLCMRRGPVVSCYENMVASGTRLSGAHHLLCIVLCNPDIPFDAWGEVPPEVTKPGAYLGFLELPVVL